MREDLKYPSSDAINSVLIKIGIDPSTRFDKYDQDIEYTSCKLEELDKYFNLYTKDDTTFYEKRVLGCYFLECLNEYFENENKCHFLQNKIFEILYSDIEIHESELEYWIDVSDPKEDNWWPITKELLTWKNT